MILLEAQSTWTINVLVRILMYLTNTWQEFIESHKLNVYSSQRIELPKPELYVIYTGERKTQPEWLSLADEFFAGDNTFLDVKVKVIYDGEEGDIIHQYVAFTKIYDEQIARYGRTRQAVLEAIRICKDSDVLKDYLESREKEVIDIMTTLFDQEYAVDRYGEEMRAEGRAEGRVEGEVIDVLKQSKATALQMKKKRALGRVHCRSPQCRPSDRASMAFGSPEGAVKLKPFIIRSGYPVDRSIPHPFTTFAGAV